MFPPGAEPVCDTIYTICWGGGGRWPARGVEEFSAGQVFT